MAYRKETTFQYLYDKFHSALQQEDESQARQFLVDHFKEFPQDVQDELFLAFFEEGLEQAAEAESARSDAVGELGINIQTLQKAKRILEDKLKAAELMEKAE